jgi:hypothetical protein
MCKTWKFHLIFVNDLIVHADVVSKVFSNTIVNSFENNSLYEKNAVLEKRVL